MDLKRKDLILKCIVEEFVKTAEPVGSVTILKNYHLDCSSATIRNTMVQLEKEGLIEKTHVSSGRVPSAKGYQYYLDHLNEENLLSSVDMEFQREFKRALDSRTHSVEDVMSRSCQMLSELTNMATVVLGPRADDEKLVSVQLLKLNEDQVMGIFVTDSGYVEKKTFVLKNMGLTFETASAAVDMLNSRLAGSRISDLADKAQSLMPILIKQVGQSGKAIIQSFVEALMSFAKKRFTVYGKKNLLALPEFADDADAFLSAVDALEDPSKLQRTMTRQDDIGSVSVGFTSENNGDLAIVSKPINGKDKIAVVGPKRMDYRKVLSALEYVVFMIDKYLGNQADNETALVPVSPPENLVVRKPAKAKKKGAKK